MLRQLVKTHRHCSNITKNPLEPTIIPSTCQLAPNIFPINTSRWQLRRGKIHKGIKLNSPKTFHIETHEFLQQTHQGEMKCRTQEEMPPAELPALRKDVSPSRPHAAALPGRTHNTNTKRKKIPNRNSWGTLPPTCTPTETPSLLFPRAAIFQKESQ